MQKELIQLADEHSYTDHDLLIVIAERTRLWGERFEKLEERVTDVERYQDKQQGLLAGGKTALVLLASLPSTLVIGILELFKRT